MKTATKAVSRLTPILIATLALTALPDLAGASTGVLAEGAGYGSPTGSPQVSLLQQRLRLVGEDAGPIDGRFGPLTKAAVSRYQRRDGLAVDGLVGPTTQTALRRALKLVGRGAGYGSPGGSARVRRLQRSLARVGARPGPVDGRFGPETQAAVVRFQQRHGLAADGVAGNATMRVLEHQLAQAEPEGEGQPAPAAKPEPEGQAAPAAKPEPEGQAAPAAEPKAEGQAAPAAEPKAEGRPAPAVKARPEGHRAAAEAPNRPPATASPPGGGRASGSSVSIGAVILLVVVIVLASAGVLGVPEKLVARRARTRPALAPVEPADELADDGDERPVVDASRRPRRPKPPTQRTPAGRQPAAERGGSKM